MSLAKKILVVDDEKDFLAVTRAHFEGGGFKVAICDNALEALNRFKKEDFDIILTDLVMPNMDGIEFIKELKKTKKDKATLTIVLSGNLNSNRLNKLEDLGIVHRFEKPVDFKKMIAFIEKRLKLELDDYASQNLLAVIKKAIQQIGVFYFDQPLVVGKHYLVTKNQNETFITAMIPYSMGSSMGYLSVSFNRVFLDKLTTRLFLDSEVKFQDHDLCDLAGEICNQIIGKIKYFLKLISIEIKIGTPSVILGNDAIFRKKTTLALGVSLEKTKGFFVLEFAADSVFHAAIKTAPDFSKVETVSISQVIYDFKVK